MKNHAIYLGTLCNWLIIIIVFIIYGLFCGAGRVNLIGEHIDYEGYSVLPMAIRQDTIVAIRKNEGQKVLRIANVNDQKYALCTYPADPNQVQNQILRVFDFL